MRIHRHRQGGIVLNKKKAFWVTVAAVLLIGGGAAFASQGEDEPEVQAQSTCQQDGLTYIINVPLALVDQQLCDTPVAQFTGEWNEFRFLYLTGWEAPSEHGIPTQQKDYASEVVSVGTDTFTVRVYDAQDTVVHEQLHERGEAAKLTVIAHSTDAKIVISDGATSTTFLIGSIQ